MLSLIINLAVVILISSRISLEETPENQEHRVVLLDSPKPEAKKVEKKEEQKKEAKPAPRERQQSPTVTEQKIVAQPTQVLAEPVQPSEPLELPSIEPPQPKAEQAPLKTEMTFGMFTSIFEESANAEYLAYSQQSQQKRRGSMRTGTMSGKVSRALQNNRSWVSKGIQEPLGKRAQLFYNYLEASHDKIHSLFADSFLASLNSLDPNDPLNDFTRMAKLEFEILASGMVNEVRVIKTSGNTVFDAAAVDSIYRSSPFDPPPKSILSYNNRVYFRWGFYRNERKCGVFNAEPYMLRAPGSAPEPIPEDKFTIIDG